MDNYFKTNLTSEPLRDASFLDELIEKVKTSKNKFSHFQLVTSKDSLSDQVISQLEQTGLEIKFVVFFGMLAPRPVDHALMHTDIVKDNDNWYFPKVAVNWELTDTITKLSWWATTKTPIHPPNSVPEHVPHGIHYDKQFNLGICTEKDKMIDQVVITKTHPVLIRTDLPHTIETCTHTTNQQERVALSVRFGQDFANWQDAYDKLSFLKL